MSINKEKINIINSIRLTLMNMKKIGEAAIVDAQIEANYHIGAMQSRYDTFKEEAQYLVAAHQIRLIRLEDEISICDSLIKKLSNDNFYFDTVELGALFVVEFEEKESKQIKAYFLVPGGTGMIVCIQGVNAICVSPNAPVVNIFQGLHIGEEPELQSTVNKFTNKIILSIR